MSTLNLDLKSIGVRVLSLTSVNALEIRSLENIGIYSDDCSHAGTRHHLQCWRACTTGSNYRNNGVVQPTSRLRSKRTS